MIRGAIDYIDGQVIGGWLHSATVGLRGRTVLAFVDDRCVGAGPLDIFRKDLADANVGDGHCGFRFGITLAGQSDRDRVVVKLEDSDMVMLQPGARVSEGEGGPLSPAMLDWMRARGWLDQVEFDFLRAIADTGAYARSLRRNRIELFDPREEANRLFDLFRQGQTSVAVETIALADLIGRRTPMLDELPSSLVAIHADEGSVTVAGNGGATGEHACGPDRLLFVDLRALVASHGAGEARLFVPR